MEPVGAGIGNDEPVGERLARLDDRLGEVGHAVHVVSDREPVPMDAGVLRQPVLEVDLQGVTLANPQRCSRDDVAVRPRRHLAAVRWQPSSLLHVRSYEVTRPEPLLAASARATAGWSGPMSTLRGAAASSFEPQPASIARLPAPVITRKSRRPIFGVYLITHSPTTVCRTYSLAAGLVSRQGQWSRPAVTSPLETGDAPERVDGGHGTVTPSPGSHRPPCRRASTTVQSAGAAGCS